MPQLLSEILRPYDPSECENFGHPLNWDRCRACSGIGRLEVHVMGREPRDDVRDCWYCGGHGSLKAAALAYFKTQRSGHWETIAEHAAIFGPNAPHRCAGCGHPASDGTWEDEHPKKRMTKRYRRRVEALRFADYALQRGDEPRDGSVIWTPCDDQCHHDDGEWRTDAPKVALALGVQGPGPAAAQSVRLLLNGFTVEASWRTVEVRTLGYPSDLRPERLAILCMRCRWLPEWRRFVAGGAVART